MRAADAAPLPPYEAWLWAINEARPLVADMGSARVIAGVAMDDWRDFMRERQSIERQRRATEGRA